MKVCSCCNTEKPLTEFWKRSYKNTNPQNHCKACQRAAYRKRHTGKNYIRNLKKYGLTKAEYDTFGHVCHVCSAKAPEGKLLNVDHDHVDGFAKLPFEEKKHHVRGLLCHGCNVSLGLLAEDPERMEALAGYIRTWHSMAHPC